MYTKKILFKLIIITHLVYLTDCFISFQDLMNREKRDKIPSMQVSFIDTICTQLYQVIPPL